MVTLVLNESGAFRDIPHLFHFVELLFVGLVKLWQRGMNVDDVSTISIPHWPHESWKGKFHEHNLKILEKVFENFIVCHTEFEKDSRDVVWVDRAECDKGGMNKMWAKYMKDFDPYEWNSCLYSDTTLPKPRPVVTYISRQGGKRRCLSEKTHKKILEFFKNKQDIIFLPIQMEDHGFEQQMKVARSTDLLIGGHGNGLTHAAFMHPHRNVVEIFPEGMSFQYDYYTLSKMMGHEYTCIYSGGPAFIHGLSLESPPSITDNFDMAIFDMLLTQIKKMN